ncbi:MAG: hypothetical protein RBU21_09005 [FCB group bacterium]|nr:hypothetical protein [FCB group bacterium]
MSLERVRRWAGAARDDGSVHCLGNGELCVYECGPDLIQVFGPPYSSGSALSLVVKPDAAVECDCVRELGTAIWSHSLRGIGTLQDFVDSDGPCFVRVAELTAPLTLVLEANADSTSVVNGQRFSGASAGLLITSPSGHPLYGHYPLPHSSNYQFVATGPVELTALPEVNRWEVKLNPGRSVLYLVGGPHSPDTRLHTEAALATPVPELLERSRAHWQAFTKRRKDFAALIPEPVPEREALLRAIDDVATTIKTQEARGGGILAGYPYHLLYVRDQYGTARCLLKLGYYEEAKAILARDWAIWQRHGRIHNAQAVGVDGVFHVHENDGVEITGYLIIQALDYAAASGDEAFPKEILPMLEWAWQAQHQHLAREMLPFNGDETYVAGGILPRTTLNDGSAEATMLFIVGGERLLAFVERHGLWPAERIAKEREVLERVRGRYAANFFVDGRYITNNPARKRGLTLPAFRHGVCEGCNAFGWTEKTDTDRYVCPVCAATKDLPAAEEVVYALQSVALMPPYVGSDILSKEQVSQTAEAIVAGFKATGKLPSRPDGNVAVGYDYGLLLYTLAQLGHPEAQSIYERMMSVVDPTGVWVEYYEDNQPRGTRCRPWESAINLEAALAHVFRKYQLPER